ncbi:MAG: T9SS type A sorting domain-containing protein [Saprospiraceae bacterium]
MGDTEYNPRDPYGYEPPRKFHYSDFYIEIPGLKEEILNCDSLVLNLPEICDGSDIEWHSNNGGYIFGDSINVTSIKTNGLGIYSVTVKCGSGCLFYDEFNPEKEDEINEISSPDVQKRITYEDGEKIIPIDRELGRPASNDLNQKNEEIMIYPNPANHKLVILLPEGNFDISLKDMLGKTIINTESSIGDRSAELNVSGISEGMIIIEIVNKYYSKEIITKKITIVH